MTTIKNIEITINKKKYNLITKPKNVLDSYKNRIVIKELEYKTGKHHTHIKNSVILGDGIIIYYNMLNYTVTQILFKDCYIDKIYITDSYNTKHPITEIFSKMDMLDIYKLEVGQYFKNIEIIRNEYKIENHIKYNIINVNN